MTNTSSSKPPAREAGYVFEFLEDRSLSIRRADMERPDAREALLTLFFLLHRVRMRDTDIDYCLANTPADWPFLTLTMDRSQAKCGLKVGRAEREPGKDSGDNSVITNIDSERMH